MAERQEIRPPMRDHAHHVELVLTVTLVVGPDELPEDVAANAYHELDDVLPGYSRMVWACAEEGAGGVWESYPREDHE